MGWGLSPPQTDPEREGRVKWRRGALPPHAGSLLHSLSCAARSRSPPGGEGRLPGVFRGRTIRGSRASEAGGARGKTYQFGFVFRLVFVGGPVPRASLVAPAHAVFLTAAASSSSGRRRPELLHLSLALSPAAQKPQVSSRAKPLGALRMSRVQGQRGLPAKRRSQATGSPQAQATPTQTTPVPPLSAGASPAPKQLQSPRSPTPSGRCLGWRKSRCLSL